MSTYNEIALVQAAETVQRIAQDVVATSTALEKRVQELEEQLNTRYWERIKADNNLLQRRVKDLSEENKGLFAWKSLFDAAPPEAHREMAERMNEADRIKPFVEVWKKRVAELRSLLYEYLNLPTSTWCTFDEERRAIDRKVRAVMKCPTCGGAGRIDSGGQNPDGSWIVLECPTCHGKK